MTLPTFSPYTALPAASLNQIVSAIEDGPRGVLDYTIVTTSSTVPSNGDEISPYEVNFSLADDRLVRIEYQFQIDMDASSSAVRFETALWNDTTDRIGRHTVLVSNATAAYLTILASFLWTPGAGTHRAVVRSEYGGSRLTGIAATSTVPGHIIAHDLGPA